MLKKLKKDLKGASKEEIFARVDELISDEQAEKKLEVLTALGLDLEDILEFALKNRE